MSRSQQFLRPKSTQDQLFLDLYTDALAAFSLRKLRTGQQYAIHATRTSDSNEQDFGFVGNDFDFASFDAWDDGGGYTIQWLDQTGNGYNAVQTGAVATPQIINNIQANQPALKFTTATDERLVIPSLPLGAFTVFSIFKGTSNALIYEHSADTTFNPGMFLYTTTGSTIQTRRAVFTRKDATVAWGTDNTMRICSHLYNGTHASHQLYANAVEIATNSVLANDPGTGTVTADFYIGGRNGSGVLSLNGYIPEMIIFSSDQSANRAAIETNLNDYWFVYGTGDAAATATGTYSSSIEA